MSPKKCAFGCQGKATLHILPKETALRNQWLQFIFNEHQRRRCASVFVCSLHFEDACFTNKAQFDAGFAKRLFLKDDAVPTKKGHDRVLEPHASTSTCVPTSQGFPSVKHTECQREHKTTVSADVKAKPLMQSVGIQCTILPSAATQTGHVRSKGTHATVSFTSVSTETAISTASTSGLGPTPVKRPKTELLDEEEIPTHLSEIQQTRDSSYEAGDPVAELSKTSGMDISRDYTDAKYIVFESCLRELFKTCPFCTNECNVQRRRLGTFVSFCQVCEHCQYTKKWQSQPMKGSTPVGNLQMSAAVYFTGGSFIQMHKICRAMNLQIHPFRSFRTHARMFLEPAVFHKWKMDQQAVFQSLQPLGKIALSGDMRADSPGHSAKYGSYTLLHPDSNKILDIQLIQSNEVGGSAHMEKEGLRRGLDHLESNQLQVDYIVTDRHTKVQKYLREREIQQYYDVWHLQKGLSKKLEKLSRNKDCQVLRNWLVAIKNHIYWSAMSSTEGPEKVAKWKSLLNHIQNVHIHEDPVFPKCAHADRVTRDPSKWLKPGTMVLYKVEKLLMNKRVLRDVEKLSHQHQTSALEAFHRVIRRFVPKNVVFPFIGMLCRLYLAAMHFNENADHEQAMNLEGNAVYRIMYPESKKGQPIVKTEPTFGYVKDLMRLVFVEVFEDPAYYAEELRKVPIPDSPSEQFDRPPKEDLIARRVSRFSPVVAGSQHSSHQHQGTLAESGGQHMMEGPQHQLTKLR
ncbi:uncharacterized protein LOC128017581 isoform X2 [Carassius gibelio]|uniref:uncharacterized protein LOC128017581 isoform X2 n=1 Tax=Carassius gibelio TaxID=101364 RepID=UPI002278F7D2|nr:uncharacterized protein LOC128017581 isoform X2 [Carassius gibelio]